MGWAGAGFSLLLLGHILGDFVFQTESMVATNSTLIPTLKHTAIVFVSHVALASLFMTTRTIVVLAVLSGSHFLFDSMKGFLRRKEVGGPNSRFLADQGLHICAIVAAWLYLGFYGIWEAPVLAFWGAVGIPPNLVTKGAVLASILAFNAQGGTTIVRNVLAAHDIGELEETSGREGSGELIGIIERWLIVVFVIYGAWSAVALVTGFKAYIRQQWERKVPYEDYVLAGTFVSVTIAVFTGLLYTWA
jgi:hypothetical protein